MKKLLMNRTPIYGPYGGGVLFVNAIVKYGPEFGFDVVHEFEPNLDAILMVDPRPDPLMIGLSEIMRYKELFPNTKVIHRINECDARKGTNGMDPMLRVCSEISDASVFISHWLKNYHTKRGWWKCENIFVGYSGVDREHFHARNKFEDGKVHLVTHHWSNNYMKGFDIYDSLDQWVGKRDDFTFTYIGRDRQTFKNTEIVKPLFGEALGAELGRYSVAISGSRFDPAPNHVIEELASGMPTYVHKDGGGAVELAGEDHIFDSFDALFAILVSKDFRPNENQVEIGDWKSCAKTYLEIAHSVLD